LTFKVGIAIFICKLQSNNNYKNKAGYKMKNTGQDSQAEGNLFDFDDNGHDPLKSIIFNSDSVTITSSEDSEDTQQDNSGISNNFEFSESDAGSHDIDTPVKVEVSENALTVLKKRYLKKDLNGNVIENTEDMFMRVAKFIAKADKFYDPEADLTKTEKTFYSMMAKLEFMPNSPTLMNAGRDLGQLSACFVLPVEDSMSSIFETIKNTAMIHKSGGGTGFSFSRVRPKNDIVKSTLGIASGPISFMHVFDVATETVKQGGTRRGANMAILRVDHPDILEFIRSKEQDKGLNNFNISVAVTDAFWDALEKEEDYDLINPHSGKVAGQLNAREVFDEIVNRAWRNGEPGIIFLDEINRGNPTPKLGLIESTNPCGEQPLLPYESCNLGSINLAKMVKFEDDIPEIDYERLGDTVRNAVHFLDNVIDMNNFPLPAIEEQTKKSRKIGLGVMGFADLLMELDIPYNSDEAISLAREVMKFIDNTAKRKSQELALQRGSFPAFEQSIYGERNEPPIRNATRTTIAPTGTISIISGCSSGIEPIFALSFTRNVMDNDKLPEIHPLIIKRLKSEGLYSEEIVKKIAEKGSVQDIKEIPESIKNVFVTSHDIEPEWHIKMQAAFQEYTNNAVSKTVNFPNHATEEDVEKVYKMAHDLKCKGVTIYRDGSRSEQVLSRGINKQEEKHSEVSVMKGRPRILKGITTKLNTGQGSLYVTINVNDSNQPIELFANIGKNGGDTAALAEAIGRLVSIALQNGVSIQDISKTLRGITGSRPVWNEGKLIKSVPDGIAQILLEQFGENNNEPMPVLHVKENKTSSDHIIKQGPECPECGNIMETEGGCSVCRFCGFSHCG